MASRRGLVISPPVTVNGNHLSIKGSTIDAQELRTYLLFWDVLNFPQNNIIDFGLSPDLQFLKDQGILTRINIILAGNFDLAVGFLAAHKLAYDQIDKQEPGVWSLARGGKSLSFSSDELKAGRGVLFSLFNSLPVPKHDVPLNDILEFKSKRSSELTALRTHLERIYQKISSSPDLNLSLQTEIDDLQSSIASYIKTAKETKFAFVLSNLEIKLDYTDLAKTYLGVEYGRSLGAAHGLELVGSLLGGLASSIKIESGAGLRDKVKTSTPFEYISSYHQEVF